MSHGAYLINSLYFFLFSTGTSRHRHSSSPSQPSGAKAHSLHHSQAPFLLQDAIIKLTRRRCDLKMLLLSLAHEQSKLHHS